MRKTFICFMEVLTSFLFVKVSALENIIVQDHYLSPRFDNNIRKYNIFLEEYESAIKIDALLSENEKSINGIGTFDIVEDESVFHLLVTDINGNIKDYVINVYRNYNNTNTNTINSTKLKNIIIKGYNIDFNPNRYTYDLNINDEDYLDIDYEVDNEKSIVVLSGNSNLKYGNNIITITVFSNDKKSKTIYKIKVNKIKKVFNNISNSNDGNLIDLSNINNTERMIIKIIIFIIVLFLEITTYKKLFIVKKN